MPKLALDTATEFCSIAVGDAGGQPDVMAFFAGRSHLELLLPAVDELLFRNDVAVRDLDGIVVGTGPGTFSGLRVGVATARALAQAAAVPLMGSSSLSALARALVRDAADASHVLPVIDARRSQVFLQLFRIHEEGKIAAESEIICLNPSDTGAFLAGFRAESVLAGGNGVAAYPDVFDGVSGLMTFAANDRRHRIDAAMHLAMPAVRETASLEALARVTPVYVREPDADRTALLRKREEWLR